jgi:hypothetical protein
MPIDFGDKPQEAHVDGVGFCRPSSRIGFYSLGRLSMPAHRNNARLFSVLAAANISLCYGVSPANAVTVNVHGPAGCFGCLPGLNGGDGGPAEALAAVSTDADNSATALGGSGGNGGSAPGGPGGAGGPGGVANATSMTSLSSGNAFASSTATGGPGGDAGTTYIAIGNEGGNGGNASGASSAITKGSGQASASTTVSGGIGGSGNQLPGGLAGAVDGATATAASDTGPAMASVRATGGKGGDGVGPLGIPSLGAPVTLMNAASGSTSGNLTVNQTAVGGQGGNSAFQGGAAGGGASSILSYTTGASFVSTNATAAGGGGGQQNGSVGWAAGGAATARVTVTETNASAEVQAKALATSGVSLGATSPATAKATILGALSGRATSTSTTTAGKGSVTVLSTAFVGGPAIASTNSAIGSQGLATIPAITAGEAYASAILAPVGSTAFGSVAMSTGYGGEGESLTYTSSATFALNDPLLGDFQLTLLSADSAGSGFGGMTFDVKINSIDHPYDFTDLHSAEMFFTDNVLDFGEIPGGVKNIAFTYGLTSETIGDGFGFDLAIGKVTPIPEPSTWTMAIVGVGFLGFARYRGTKRLAQA